MNDTLRMQDMTWEEIEQRIETSQKTVIIPVGSTEQHGPHLPLGTDTYVAMAVAEAAAGRTGVPVAPPLWFGWSPHHMVLPGTVTIRPEILTEIAYDIVSSLHRHGFERFILLNGHRIVNLAWLQIAGERAKRELGVRVVIFDPAYMSKGFESGLGWGPVGHAEEIEGSHMWHCYPGLVKMERAVDNPHEAKPLYAVDPRHTGDTLCYVPGSPAEMAPSVERAGGTTGEPSKASQEGGKRYHAYLVDRLVEVIGNLHQR